MAHICSTFSSRSPIHLSSDGWDGGTFPAATISTSAVRVARAGCGHAWDGACHWHIDYLRAVAQVRNALYTVTDSSLECVWSRALAQLPQAFIPVPYFGAGDCRSGCRAHLIAVPRRSDIARVRLALQEITPTPVESLAPVVR